MSLDMLIPAVAFIVVTLLMVGLPALAIVVVKYFKLKERELTLEMEYRHKAQQRDLALEQRLHRLEEALGQSATPLQSHPDLLEGPAAPEADRMMPTDPWKKTR